MNIDIYNSIDIILFSCVILVVIVIHTFINCETMTLSSRYRTMLAISIIIILLCDLIASLRLPFSSQTVHALKYTIIFIYLILQPLPVSLGLMYLFSLFREKRFLPREILLFMIPFIAGCIIMIYSHFTGFIFFIDDANNYHRGQGMFIFAIINYSYIVPAAGLIIHYHDIIKRQTLMIILAYTIIPFTGSLIQLLFYGIITAWPSFAVALLIAYIFMESRRSDRDYLTGLLNRQSFDAKVYGRMQQYARRGAFSLVVIDLDRFKSINDNYGHDKGDEVLQAAGVILSRSVSAADTVARYGGDEFVIILETDDRQIVESILSRIKRNVTNWNSKNDEPFSLSLSAGYVTFNPAVHKGYEELFKEADALMYERKAAGRG